LFIVTGLGLGGAVVGLFPLNFKYYFGWIIAIVIFIALVLAVHLYIEMADIKNDEEDDEELNKAIKTSKEDKKEAKRLGGVIEVLNSSALGNYEFLRELFEGVHDNGEKIDTVLKNSKKQLQYLVEAIERDLLFFFGKEKRDINVLTKLAYRIPDTNNIKSEWRYVYGEEIPKFPLSKIAKGDSGSTFALVVNQDSEFAFFNNKEEAEKRGEYLREPTETYNPLPGSIFCQYIPVALTYTETKLIEAVLTISTKNLPFKDNYGKELSEEDEKNLGIEINWKVFSHYENRIKIELIHLYIHSRDNAIKKANEKNNKRKKV